MGSVELASYVICSLSSSRKFEDRMTTSETQKLEQI